MIIPEINFEVQVASRAAAERLLAEEPQRWCVISIRGPRETKANLTSARVAVQVFFDDVTSESEMFGPRLVHARLIIEAAEKFIGDPLLVHCTLGISRSPAAALGILYLHAKRNSLPDPVDFALTSLGQLGDFSPNTLLAKLMISALEPNDRRPLERLRKHPLWKIGEAEDLYSRLLPKPRRD